MTTWTATVEFVYISVIDVDIIECNVNFSGFSSAVKATKSEIQREPVACKRTYLLGAMNNAREIDIIERNKIANAVLVLLEKVPGAAFTSKRAFISVIGFDGAVVSNEDYVIVKAKVLE